MIKCLFNSFIRCPPFYELFSFTPLPCIKFLLIFFYFAYFCSFDIYFNRCILSRMFFFYISFFFSSLFPISAIFPCLFAHIFFVHRWEHLPLYFSFLAVMFFISLSSHWIIILPFLFKVFFFFLHVFLPYFSFNFLSSLTPRFSTDAIF